MSNPVYERFTDRARKVMALANQAALRRNHAAIGTDHVPLALLKEGSGAGAIILKSIVGDLSNVRMELEKSMTTGGHDVADAKRPLGDEAKKLIEDAINEARSMNHGYIGTEHLLLAVPHQPDSLAAKTLTQFGVSLSQLRQGIVDLLGVGYCHHSQTNEVVMRAQLQSLGKDEGTPVWFLGSLTLVKATGDTTVGAFGLIEQLMPVGFATPYHVHHLEDEAFYVLEGELQFICDGKKLTVGPGGYLFGPREVPHGFRVVGTTPARSLVLNTPAGFEQFVLEMGDAATQRVIPTPAPPDMGKLIALAAKRRIDILGPLPEWTSLGYRLPLSKFDDV